MIALGTVVQPIINEINIDDMSEEVFKDFLKDRKTLVFTEKIADMQALLDIHPWLPHTHAQQSVKEQAASVELFTKSPKAVLVVTPIMDSGVDIPDVDTVIHYRTSASSVKCIQRGGRAMRRPTPDKTVCYWFHNTATRKERKTFRTLVDTVYNLDAAFRRGMYGKY
jgi:ERCC4-related helicase